MYLLLLMPLACASRMVAMYSRVFVLLGALSLLVVMPIHATTVAFINPGNHDEPYWQSASSAMHAAAKQLGFQLEVNFAQRNPLRAIEIARLLAARTPERQPEVIVFSNDHGTGPEILKILAPTRSKVFIAFSTINTDGERAQTGRPRERYANWIGSLVPDPETAGYLSAKQLIEQGRKARLHAPDGRLHVIALAGDRSTPSSVLRNQGMSRAIVESPDAVLAQMVYAKWQTDTAAEQTDWLYARYPDAKLVWSGNDLMAFGAMQTWQQRGGIVGQTALFSAINTSPAAIAAVQNGRLAALVAGHHLNGAFALVLIYDYLNGKDFAPLELQASMFGVMTPELAARYQQQFGEQDFSAIDFKSYSRVHQPSRKQYRFTLDTWLK
jgi:ABC-type sugar transport system substrate-binding protein